MTMRRTNNHSATTAPNSSGPRTLTYVLRIIQHRFNSSVPAMQARALPHENGFPAVDFSKIFEPSGNAKQAHRATAGEGH